MNKREEELLQLVSARFEEEFICAKVVIGPRDGCQTLEFPRYADEEEKNDALRPVIAELKGIHNSYALPLQRMRELGHGIRGLLQYYLECPIGTREMPKEEARRAKEVIDFILTDDLKEDLDQLEQMLDLGGWAGIWGAVASVLLATVSPGAVVVTVEPDLDVREVPPVARHFIPKPMEVCSLAGSYTTAKVVAKTVAIGWLFHDFMMTVHGTRGWQRLLNDAEDAMEEN